ncbi:hypothetical protein SLS58_008819 [Diplodia intermedia]|uniref:Uncharacterized protein n=1 Tax=Diplodia intermedia TaxID=856260 RepID=A0ABR3TGF9_9PEZI
MKEVNLHKVYAELLKLYEAAQKWQLSPFVYGGDIAKTFFLGYRDLSNVPLNDDLPLPMGRRTYWPPSVIPFIVKSIKRWYTNHRYLPLRSRRISLDSVMDKVRLALEQNAAWPNLMVFMFLANTAVHPIEVGCFVRNEAQKTVSTEDAAFVLDTIPPHPFDFASEIGWGGICRATERSADPQLEATKRAKHADTDPGNDPSINLYRPHDGDDFHATQQQGCNDGDDPHVAQHGYNDDDLFVAQGEGFDDDDNSHVDQHGYNNGAAFHANPAIDPVVEGFENEKFWTSNSPDPSWVQGGPSYMRWWEDGWSVLECGWGCGAAIPSRNAPPEWKLNPRWRELTSEGENLLSKTKDSKPIGPAPSKAMASHMRHCRGPHYRRVIYTYPKVRPFSIPRYILS